LDVGQQQPAQTGTVGHVGGHRQPQYHHAARTLNSFGEAGGYAGAGQFDHKIWAEEREAAALLRIKGLLAIQADQGRIGCCEEDDLGQ
jgi:hypothetical protein